MTLYGYDCDGNVVPVRPARAPASTTAQPKASRFAHPSASAKALELAVGVEVYSLTRRDSDDNPVGGVVIECHAGSSGTDEYGEIFERPASFTLFDRFRPWHQAFAELAEPDLDLGMATVPATSSLVGIVRRMAGEIARFKQARGTRKRGSGLLTSREIDLCRYIGALVKVIANAGAVSISVPKAQETDEF